MPREKTPAEVYAELSAKGEYVEASLDRAEIQKVAGMALEDYAYGRLLKAAKNPNWRVIFNIYYDALRELCGQLMRFRKQKTSNHQGLFAFIILNFREMELDWNFLESIRTVRNQNKYRGADISRDAWKMHEAGFDVYISTLKKEIEKRCREI